MIIATELPNEKERVEALRSYEILDSLQEKDYDDLTCLASEICQTPISLISFIDDKRQWFKSKHGLAVSETPKDFAFCAHAITNPKEILIVPDSREDKRFAGNPLVTGDPHVIFYAGVPLVDENGFALGSLCVIDNEVKKLTDKQIHALKILAGQVVSMLRTRKQNNSLKKINAVVDERNIELQQLIRMAVKELEPDIQNLSEMLQALKYKNRFNKEYDELLQSISSKFQSVNNFISKVKAV